MKLNWQLMGLLGLSLGSLVTAGTITAQAKTTIKAKLTTSAVTYQAANKTATFTGKTSNGKVKHIVVTYGKTKHTTTTVKKQQFKVSKAFTGYRDFKLYGTTAKGKRITKVQTITSARYATQKPLVTRTDRSGVTGSLMVTAQVPAASVATVYKNGRFLTKQYNETTTAFFGLTDITATKYKLTVTAKKADRKASPAVTVPVVKPGLIMETNYYY